jgi:hypothetical protein
MSPNTALTKLVDLMIPADRERGLPSGSEVDISRVLPAHLEVEDLEMLAEQFEALISSHGHGLLELTDGTFHEFIQKNRPKIDPILREIGKYLLMSYYTDSLVRDVIGVGARPPFPAGYPVHEGDLSLLESVFERGPIFRKVDNE